VSIKGKKLVLSPQREGVIPIPVVKKGVNLLFMSRFLEEVGEEGVMYALLPCEKGLEEDGHVPVEQ